MVEKRISEFEKETIGYPTERGIIKEGIIHTDLGGSARDGNDHSALRHGERIHEGTMIRSAIMPPPLIFTKEGHNVWFGNMHRNGHAFLIASGPSFSKLDHKKLNEAGALTMGLNNSVKTFRPNMWCCVDDPSNFIKSIWLDPKIMKFVPMSHAQKTLFDNEAWHMMSKTVGECPNVWYFKRNEHFVAEQYLFEDTVNWGNHKNYGGGRSVLLAAIRILFYIGIRKLYLCGVDFKMDDNNKYHFEQERAKSSQNGNMATYSMLIKRFEELKPIFDKHGFEVYNLNPESNLKVFPFISLDEALVKAQAELPKNLAEERTEGLYDRKARIEAQQKAELEIKKKRERGKTRKIVPLNREVSTSQKILGQSVSTKVGPGIKQIEYSNTIKAKFEQYKEFEFTDLQEPVESKEDLKIAVKAALDRYRYNLSIAKERLEEHSLLCPVELPPDSENYKLWKAQNKTLDDIVNEKREEFRNAERRKNIIWFGQHPAPKR